MGRLVNLNKARKARDRAEAKTTAQANRAVYGRTKADRAAAKIERERAERSLDGARRDQRED